MEYPAWLWLTLRHGSQMAPIESSMIFPAWKPPFMVGDFPWRTVSHNQMVNRSGLAFHAINWSWVKTQRYVLRYVPWALKQLGPRFVFFNATNGNFKGNSNWPIPNSIPIHKTRSHFWPESCRITLNWFLELVTSSDPTGERKSLILQVWLLKKMVEMCHLSRFGWHHVTLCHWYPVINSLYMWMT